MKKICSNCSKEFETKAYNRLMCDDCRNKKRYCVICGKEIFGKGKTCSRSCNVSLGNRTKKLDPNYSKIKSDNAKKGWKNISDENKKKHSEGISNTYKNKSDEEKRRLSKINSESKKLKWNNRSKEEKEKLNKNRGRNNALHNKNSGKEQDIIKFLKEEFQNTNIIQNTRDLIVNPNTGHKLELDIYLPDYNLAIEYNSNYFHNKDNPEREELKSFLCKQKGIKLIHIWEDEWNCNKEQIKNLIIEELKRR